MLLRQRLGAKSLEMRYELLAFGEEASLGEHSRPDAALDALHEGRVLASDLAVEGDQLVHPGLLHVRREEVVQEASGALRGERQHRAAGQVRPAREDVDAEVGPEEVELAARHLAACEEGGAVLAQRAELARDETVGFQPVRVW